MASFIHSILPDWEINIGRVIGKKEQIVVMIPFNEQVNSISQEGKLQLSIFTDDSRGMFDFEKNLQIRQKIEQELKNIDYQIPTQLGNPTYSFTLIPDQVWDADYFEDIGLYGRVILFNFVAIQKQ
jgi:hypothetical protein